MRRRRSGGREKQGAEGCVRAVHGRARRAACTGAARTRARRSGVAWSCPGAAEGRGETVGCGVEASGRLRCLLHSGEHHGMATGALLPGNVEWRDQIDRPRWLSGARRGLQRLGKRGSEDQ